MKHFLAIGLVLFLTACGGDNRQVLPPELQGGPLSTTPVTADPLSNLPFDPVAEVPITEEISEESSVAEAETPKPETTRLVAGNCEALTSDLETSFADMNFCETNDDCQVAEGSCPFGCYLFHNAKIDFADYKDALTAYQEGCNPCEYQCADAPKASERRCVEGRCVDTRYL